MAISRRQPVLREAAIVRLIRNRILELLEKEPIDLIHAHSPALCGLGALQAARSKRLLSFMSYALSGKTPPSIRTKPARVLSATA